MATSPPRSVPPICDSRRVSSSIAGWPIRSKAGACWRDSTTRAGSCQSWSSTQMSHELQADAGRYLGMEPGRMRVIAPDVGGGFGAKLSSTRRKSRSLPLRGVCSVPSNGSRTASEHFVSAIQERDQYWDVEIAADDAGMIIGVRGRMIHDQGAYTPQGINLPLQRGDGGHRVRTSCRLLRSRRFRRVRRTKGVHHSGPRRRLPGRHVRDGAAARSRSRASLDSTVRCANSRNLCPRTKCRT